MSPNQTSQKIDIRPTRSEDVQHVLELFGQTNADLPPFSLAMYELHRREHEGKWYEAYVADLGGSIVGTFDLFDTRWTPDPHIFELFGQVDQAHRRQGIGSQLHDLMLERATCAGATRIYVLVRESIPEGITFLEHRGWERTGRADRMSRLDVASANLKDFTGLEDRLRDEGIQIKSLAEIGTGDMDFLRAQLDMEYRTQFDMPSSEEPGEEPFDRWLDRQLNGPGRSPQTFWIALDGEKPVGLARVHRRGENAVFNGYTAVDRDYRGRSIARALKLKTVEWARENGIEAIFTGNDVSNRPMLAINESLGYQGLPAAVELVLNL